MQTKITFQRRHDRPRHVQPREHAPVVGRQRLRGQVQADLLQGGLRATSSEGYNAARTAANAAGGLGTPAGDAAFDNSLITRFNTTYNSTSATTGTSRRRTRRTRTCSAARPTRARAVAYIALRQILGKDNFDKARKEIQTTYGGGSITAAAADRDLQEVDAEPVRRLPRQARRSSSSSGGTRPTSARPAAGNKPSITGPGLAGRASMTPTAAARTTATMSRARRRHRPGDAGADARHAGGVRRRSRRASAKDYTAARPRT